MALRIRVFKRSTLTECGWMLAAMAAQPRTGLVLGGGGLVGGAWMVGALDAIAQKSGWDPSPSTKPMSPVLSQPWLIMSEVASGRFL